MPITPWDSLTDRDVREIVRKQFKKEIKQNMETKVFAVENEMTVTCVATSPELGVCQKCDGTGQVLVEGNGEDLAFYYEDCPDCKDTSLEQDTND